MVLLVFYEWCELPSGSSIYQSGQRPKYGEGIYFKFMQECLIYRQQDRHSPNQFSRSLTMAACVSLARH